MYVAEVILEGFKTYMNRTVVGPFDPHFNAITGFNGSGKSNILDAIQFLMGSTSKEYLRLKAGLTELIYKEGFAGIEKASVTIRFKCPDRSARPTGYENCEEVTITRQITKDKVSKFFVNGTSSNLSKVRNLFRSVQMNIENPHFLIKQGQITKIINLKPTELMGMLEETAGTAYYHRTKQESERLIEKKEQKLKAINEILSDSIEPQMQKLDAERRRYIAYKDKESLKAQLTEKISIFELVSRQRAVRQKEDEANSVTETMEIRQQQRNNDSQRLKELEGQMKELVAKGPSPINDYHRVKNLLTEKENERAQVRGRVKKLNEDALGAKKERAELEEQIQQKKQQKEWQEKTVLQADGQREELEGLLEEFGRKGNEKEAAQMIQKMIAQEEKIVKNLDIELKVIADKKKTVRMQMDNEKRIMAEAEQSKETLAQNLTDLEKEISDLEGLKTPETVEDPELKAGPLRDLEGTRKRLLGQCYQLTFNYNSPTENFDRSKVKGKVFQLFLSKDAIHEKALEVGAGGRLHNVVVENQLISKLLLERESIGRNVTIIPNNKIRYRRINPEVVQHADRIAKELKGLARPASDLITYNKDVQNALFYVFSGFMVCSSPEIAQKVAYGPRHMSCKCVTYDGDVFEQGTLSGGYMNQGNMILPQYKQLREIEEKIKKEKSGMEAEKAKYEVYQKEMIAVRNMQRNMEAKTARRDKLKNKLMNLELQVKKKDFEKELSDIEAKMKELEGERNEHMQKAEKQKKNLQGKNVKSVEEQRKELQGDLSKANKKLSEAKKMTSRLEVELQELKVSVRHQGVTADELQKEIVELEAAERQVGGSIREFQTEFERLEEEKRKYDKEVALNEAKNKSLYREVNDLKAAIEKGEGEMSELQSSLNSIKNELTKHSKAIDELLDNNAWLDPNEDYQLDPGFNIEQARADLKTVEGQVEKLKRSARTTIDDHSFQKLHENYKNLMDKRSTLEKDKVTLLTNIHDLDEKRTKTLEKCFESVQRHLGMIFSDLLPGATAVLTLIDPRDVTKGAEMSVMFNNVKKELGELSGGQRSLLALSFILALLLYKPSPFYILDEIDSALDLSHTENIGYMISQRFPQSQFILISLKEGMFQNANVLFKVHFAEGESKVDRQTMALQPHRRK